MSQTSLELLDKPPSDVGDYIEDVLPMHATFVDVEAALRKRGFEAISESGQRLLTWQRQVRGGKSGYLSLFGQSGVCTLDFWPRGKPRERQTGSLRAMLREIDRIIAAFEPAGWKAF